MLETLLQEGDVQAQPLIAVKDVEASSTWYRQLLDCKSGHGGRDYEQILSDGELILQLHDWDADEHPFMGDKETPSRGNGVLLWFMTPDFNGAMKRAKELGVEVLEDPFVNPNAQHRECWIRDPDGYVVVLAGPRGDVG